jgi:hypothetical protein
LPIGSLLRLWSATLTIGDGRVSHFDANLLAALAPLIDVENIGPNDGYPDYALAARVLAHFPEAVIVRADPPHPDEYTPGRVY